MTKRVKENTLSAFKNNMNCRNCNLQEEETQEHLEVCKGTKDMIIRHENQDGNMKNNLPINSKEKMKKGIERWKIH